MYPHTAPNTSNPTGSPIKAILSEDSGLPDERKFELTVIWISQGEQS